MHIDDFSDQVFCTLKMYQQVVGQSSGDKGRIMVIDIFHQNIHRLSFKSCTAFSRNFLYFCKQTVKTVFHYIIRDLIFHNSCRGSGTLGIDKGKRCLEPSGRSPAPAMVSRKPPRESLL